MSTENKPWWLKQLITCSRHQTPTENVSRNTFCILPANQASVLQILFHRQFLRQQCFLTPCGLLEHFLHKLRGEKCFPQGLVLFQRKGKEKHLLGLLESWNRTLEAGARVTWSLSGASLSACKFQWAYTLALPLAPRNSFWPAHLTHCLTSQQ